MAEHSGEIVNLTIKVERGVLRIFGVVEEHRRVRRQSEKFRQPIREPW